MLSALVFSCVVIAVADGDTLTARCPAPQGTLRVRLAEVDAPEKAQAYGSASRRQLAALCLRRPAEVRPLPGAAGHDRYGRAVAHVRCGGRDAGTAQLRAGLAWVAEGYASDLNLPALQWQARHERAGLWADARPLPPWVWRRRHRR
ncbi:thermonuclease family protein [Rubrivivax gelatinosus]|uniref:SNase-like nuclease n=1 Tax=Rubrivivax gelatinosus (strain NBRC 100245 / IL144) TaxID=983917 RepID=I0HN99_RUBGI|nr:thermonuclease family protein [Rubrivivax gelatinosus]MBG6081094.1 endonuclease YncB(thermonuclease family) [Rubrivivax gelatinosus]BAL94486.1 SNase-like nuclease [Rubrivivax gelatinosus IL144]